MASLYLAAIFFFFSGVLSTSLISAHFSPSFYLYGASFIIVSCQCVTSHPCIYRIIENIDIEYKYRSCIHTRDMLTSIVVRQQPLLLRVQCIHSVFYVQLSQIAYILEQILYTSSGVQISQKNFYETYYNQCRLQRFVSGCLQ